MDGGHVGAAVDEMVRTLTPYVARDWTAPAGSLDWSCWTTAAHVAHDLLAYAGQLAGRPDADYLPFDLVVHADAPPEQVLRVVAACGRLLCDALATAPPTTRAWHWGPTDPTGFAALGVNEALLHTWDITQGLAVPWRPPPALCELVLARLFPHAPAVAPPEALLWCTGRAALPGRPRLTSWTLKAALDPAP
ncbi:maleylpyruvate isomerase N-terminal domain-containing protein [Actinoplanes sp. RD1]|uniref:maleylpyruvate isomerase N-terminal domain-containing protein n=1 Tax=Actinoplanes sp. RD1 TaxID=3064538 RepID=UPI0027412000|nr:maleylpyruvate isomerase N-terminal domain-containing protein [Actinoplanes sp. RD1]